MFYQIQNWIKEHRLGSFILIAFGYTWTFQILLSAINPEAAQMMGNFRLAVYGPSIAALVVPLIIQGPQGLFEFLKKRLIPRGGWIWYGVALFLIPALLIVVRGAHSLIYPEIPLDVPLLKGQAAHILLGYLMALTFGPLAEELGWRGFALPELQKRVNPLLASLVLGVIWWAWHLPSLLIPAYQWAVGGIPPLLYLVIIMPGAVLAAWIYNHSRGCVLPAILFHGSMNYFMGLLGFNSPHFLPFVLGGLWGITILAGILWQRELSKDRRNPGSLVPGAEAVRN